jgi:hypothetical protein
MRELVAEVERRLGGSWHDAIEHLRDINSIDDIADAVHRGDIDGAVQGVAQAAKAFAADEHGAYVDSGERAAAWLDSAVPDKLVRFDATNTRAVAWAKANQLDMVREVTGEQRDLIRRVIADGVAAGRNPREVARDLRDSSGLTDYQAKIVANYRTALESGDLAGALGRELSDGRDDRSVAAAMRDGRAIPQAQIDKMVERYRSNWVGFRAETIARTEGLRVVHQGTEEMFQQAVDNGDVDDDALEREWNHASVGKDPRESHEAMNGQKRGLGEAFESGDGASLKYPGDPDADPSETLNCRCVVSTRLVA